MMKRLKELRLAHNYSQAQLAEMLKTTQQTIARWETGKSEPSIAALRDLAFIFQTSVDDLLGQNPISNKVTTSYWFRLLQKKNDKIEQDGYWGNLGILLPGQEKTRWYPITLGSVEALSRSLANLKESDWLCVETLNNRMLAINPIKLERLWLLDEACDGPEEDWEIEWDSVEGWPLELYKALDEYFSGSDLKESCSDTFIATVEDIIKEYNLDEEKVFKMIHYTSVYMADGRVTTYWAEDDQLWDLVTDIENDDVPMMIKLHHPDQFDSYYPSKKVALVDMPLLEVMEAARRELEELEGDTI